MCGRQKKLKIKNKNPCHCHVMESGESDGIWGIFEESFLYKERIKKKKNYMEQNQKYTILHGVKNY